MYNVNVLPKVDRFFQPETIVTKFAKDKHGWVWFSSHSLKTLFQFAVTFTMSVQLLHCVFFLRDGLKHGGVNLCIRFLRITFPYLSKAITKWLVSFLQYFPCSGRCGDNNENSSFYLKRKDVKKVYILHSKYTEKLKPPKSN